MTGHRRRSGRRLAAVLAGLLPAVLLAACITTDLDRSTPAPSQPAPSPTSVAVATPTAVPESTPEATLAPPSPSPSPAPQPTPSTAPGVAGLPDPTDEPNRGGDGARPSPLGRGGRVEVPGYGVVLTLPKGWRTLDLGGDDLEALLESLPRRAIDPATAAQLLGLLNDRVRLLALDLQRANRGASLNVTAFDQPIPSFLLRSTAELALAAVPGVRDPRFRDLTIDGSPAVRADFTITLGEGRQRTTYRATQVLLTIDDATVLVTVAIPKGGQVDDADRIVRSLGLD